jgi:hypothetical protein
MSDKKPTETKPTGLALLREPFPANQISKLPKGNVMLDYVGHAALTDRLLDADPAWNWEPLAFTPDGLPALDQNGGLWIKLTLCGLTRLGYGHAGAKKGGDAIKEIIGDALRNAGMRFGAALDLWHKGQLHEEPEEPVEAPEGYVEWKAGIAGVAVEGGEAWAKAWKESPSDCKSYLRNHDRETLAAWTKAAEQFKAQESA